MRSSLPFAASVLLLLCPVAAQRSSRMVLESQVPFAPCTTAHVWAIGDYLLVARRSEGFAVIDVRIPSRPVTVTIRPPGYPASPSSLGVGDIKSDGRYIYVTNENWSAAAGMFIYDAGTDPMNPTYVGALQHPNVPGTHNCWIDPTSDTLYCIARGRVQVFDVSNKASPQFLATMGNDLPSGTAHDVIVLDGRAYCSFWTGGIAIYDVRIPSNPQLIVHTQYANSFTHNMWPSEDRKYLYTTDENWNAPVRIWDISRLPQMTQVGTYQAGPTGSMAHNVHVHGDMLFVAYYKEGLRVCSIRDPIRPVEIAYYDTYLPTADGCWGANAGCYGTFPYHHFGVFAGDIDSGVYIFRFNPVTHSFSARTPTVPPGGVMTLDFTYRNDAPAALNGFGVIFLAKVNDTQALSLLSADAALLAPSQNRPFSFRLPIPLAIPIGWPLDFRAYSGTFDPLIVSEITAVRVTVQ